MIDLLLELGRGLGISAAIFALTLLFSLPLGLLLALGRMSSIVSLRWTVGGYISIMRGTPLMLQLFFVYFGPWYIFHIPISDSYRFISVILAFSLNYAAYFAEIYRAGIESIDPGQREAAAALGFGRFKAFFRIVFPQVCKRILPSVTNETITLVKDTSLAFALSVMEMFTIARMEASARTTMVPFIVAGVYYYIFNFIVAWTMARIERRLSYFN